MSQSAFQSAGETLILASASMARAALLAQAGLVFTQRPAQIDEGAVRAALGPYKADAVDIAASLAERKAEVVSAQAPGALIIGADQVLEADAAVLEKPRDMAGARSQLLALRGRTHALHSALCLMRDGVVLWRHVETARLTMREFSSDFLDRYLAVSGESILNCVGSYQLEGPGIQLFSQIEGDYFTILGLPLLPLLQELRRLGVILA